MPKDLKYNSIELKYQYAIDRFYAYSKLNQFEMIYNDMINGTTTWLEAIKSIKEKFPKPSDDFEEV